jgi:hypothetical protein
VLDPTKTALSSFLLFFGLPFGENRDGFLSFMEPSTKRGSLLIRIWNHLRSPGIDSEDSIPPAYVAWRAGTTKRVIVPGRHAI